MDVKVRAVPAPVIFIVPLFATVTFPVNVFAFVALPKDIVPLIVVVPVTDNKIPEILELAPAETIKLPPTFNVRLAPVPFVPPVPFIVRLLIIDSVRVLFG